MAFRSRQEPWFFWLTKFGNTDPCHVRPEHRRLFLCGFPPGGKSCNPQIFPVPEFGDVDNLAGTVGEVLSQVADGTKPRDVKPLNGKLPHGVSFPEACQDLINFLGDFS